MAVTEANDVDGRPLHLVEIGLVCPLDTFIVDKLERLAARGMRVTAAVTPEPGDVAPPISGVQVLTQPHWHEPVANMLVGIARDAMRLLVSRPRTLMRVLRSARRSAPPGRFARRLRAYLPLAAISPDVVHFEWGSGAVKFQPLVDVWGCPHVISCHGSEVNVRPYLPGGEPFARAVGRALAGADAVHCVSQSVARQAQRLGADPDRIRLIPSGVDVTEFTLSPHKEPADHLRIVSVGRLRELKGHEYAIRALRLLSDGGTAANLEVIGGDPTAALGDASQRTHLTHLIKQLDLTHRVTLRGAMAHAEVKERLQAADAFLHTSVSEGCCVAVLEAMACGLPVVLADYPGAREVITDGIDGVLIPMRSPEAAAAALQRLHEDPSLKQRLGAAARARVKWRFTAERQVDQFLSLYAQTGAAGSLRHQRAAQKSDAPRRLGPPPRTSGPQGVTKPSTFPPQSPRRGNRRPDPRLDIAPPEELAHHRHEP